MNQRPSFGHIVKERRKALGLTQTELAGRVGCAPVTLRKIEYNALRPSTQMAEQLALALQIPEAEQLVFVRLARQERNPSPIPPLPPAPEEIGRKDLSGRSIKGFELGERIGEGGYGAVYRAVQATVERDVAIKIILPKYANQPEFIRRFEAEAQLVARLEHPHIVPLYDYWREPGVAYLVMRFLRGGSLDTRLKQGPLERYPDILHMLADLRQAMKPESTIADSTDNRPDSITPPHIAAMIELPDLENPYKGLRAFGEADANDFFGRNTLIQALLVRLAEESDLSRFLAVVGPSGSGKSSVVKAGLMPALRQGGLPGSDNWFLVEMTPGTYPLEELETALLRVAVNPPVSLLAQLREDERGLLRAVHRILPAGEDVELVLIIDQFEEMFTLVTGEDVRHHFLDSLVTAVLDPRSRLRVVITLRADFTDRPLQYVDFGELVRQQTEFVLPLTPDELEQAITGPTRRAGLALEPGLVSTIIDDIGNQPGMLPLLQYALTELFERREGRKLTLAAYQASGGVLGALARRAEELYTHLDEAGQAAARQLFLRLVTLGEGTEDTRRRVLRAELEALTGPAMADEREVMNGNANGQPAAVSSQQSTVMGQVMDRFGRYRLLTFDHDPVTREPTVEVAHEALLREWRRLREWLNASRTDVRLQRLLAVAATEWTQANRDPGFCYGEDASTNSRAGRPVRNWP